MVEPEKPFACSMPDCGMTFTNEDHLHVHTKKHDMVLQLGLEQKAAFVADQTPTPTRFIRNCEEVGLFLDLQSDNPFEEGFKRAMETAKHGLLSIEQQPATSTDDLHTPQMTFPLIDHGDSALYSTTNNQRNITISRSSSDESGAIKEYETTTISKLTNKVTTISRRVEKHDIDKASATDDITTTETINKDVLNETVSYTNNVIKIRTDNINLEGKHHAPINFISYTDSVIKDVNTAKDLTDTDKIQIPPVMSQKSIDFVVDSLTSDLCRNEDKVDDRNKKVTKVNKDSTLDNDGEYSVTITLPGGKQLKMKSVEETPPKNVIRNKTRERLKNVITNKVQSVPVIQNLPMGTLIPVTIIPSNQVLNKIPIVPLTPAVRSREIRRPIKKRKPNNKVSETLNDDDCILVDVTPPSKDKKKISRDDLDSRVAASRRYRVRLKETMNRQEREIKILREANQRLTAEVASLKILLMEHMKNCPNADDLRTTQEKLVNSTGTT